MLHKKNKDFITKLVRFQIFPAFISFVHWYLTHFGFFMQGVGHICSDWLFSLFLFYVTCTPFYFCSFWFVKGAIYVKYLLTWTLSQQEAPPGLLEEVEEKFLLGAEGNSSFRHLVLQMFKNLKEDSSEEINAVCHRTSFHICSRSFSWLLSSPFSSKSLYLSCCQ